LIGVLSLFWCYYVCIWTPSLSRRYVVVIPAWLCLYFDFVGMSSWTRHDFVVIPWWCRHYVILILSFSAQLKKVKLDSTITEFSLSDPLERTFSLAEFKMCWQCMFLIIFKTCYTLDAAFDFLRRTNCAQYPPHILQTLYSLLTHLI